MGSLIVRHYPAKLFGGAADHTYVECGTGAKGWSCWGGKEGGKFLRAAIGSTRRADAIAEPDERAGVTCYLVNGVCHQAANRILMPAEITVDGTRGYSLSVALFGLYGRTSGILGFCKAPIISQSGVSGDLEECIGIAASDIGEVSNLNEQDLDYTDAHYISKVHDIYRQIGGNEPGSAKSSTEPQMQLFELLIEHKLTRHSMRLSATSYASLMATREQFEAERLRAEGELVATGDGHSFATRFNKLTLAFQSELALVLESESYRTLIGLAPDDRIVLSDPEFVASAYPPRPKSQRDGP